MDDGLGYDELPEFLLSFLSKSRHNGFLASFSLTPPHGSVGTLLRGASEHHLVLGYGGCSALACPPDTTEDRLSKAAKGRGERRGISKAFLGREFLNTPFLPLKSLLHLPQDPLTLLSSEGNQTQRLRFWTLPSRREMTVWACVR